MKNFSTVDKLSQKCRDSLGLANTKFARREREPNEATGWLISKMEGNYVQPCMDSPRQAGMQFLGVKSKGIPC